MDEKIPKYKRYIDKPYLLANDYILNIKGRKCVVTGTVEMGRPKIGDDVDIVGYQRKSIRTTILS
jgi:elongation factor Tu